MMCINCAWKIGARLDKKANNKIGQQPPFFHPKISAKANKKKKRNSHVIQMYVYIYVYVYIYIYIYTCKSWENEKK